MDFFCYHRDREGSTSLRQDLVEEHWSYMDGFTAMIARGPTFRPDGTLAGSVHILDLPSPAAAREFAFAEPGYQAGAYRDVMVRRWHDLSGRTMWDHEGGVPEDSGHLVIGFTPGPTADLADLPSSEAVIVGGLLVSDDGSVVIGAAALVDAPDASTAGELLRAGQYVGVEVHPWRPGGRPA